MISDEFEILLVAQITILGCLRLFGHLVDEISHWTLPVDGMLLFYKDR
jgi:hypothetical protein